MPALPQGRTVIPVAHCDTQVRAPWKLLQTARQDDPERPRPFDLLNDTIAARVNAMADEADGRHWFQDLAEIVTGGVDDAMRGCQELYEYLGYRRYDLKCAIRLCVRAENAPDPCLVTNVGALTAHPACFAYIRWPERLIVMRHPKISWPADF